MEEYIGSLKNDLGPDAVVEVKNITPLGEVITVVTFPSGVPAGIAQEAEDRIAEGIEGFKALASNAWLSQLGELLVDPTSAESVQVAPPAPVNIEFVLGFSDPAALVTPP